MTNNQLAENSVIQLLNSVKLARDNAERADNRVDHSFYYALTIALEELQERRKAAMDSESACHLSLDYLQGHKDGLEWAARLAEANHPETGDWLYDDPTELAKAIRKGPDMPPAQPVEDSEPDRNPVLAYADSYRDMAKQGVQSVPIWSVITDLERNIAPLYRHAQPVPVVPDDVLAAIQKVARIRLDLNDFDGDRRGIADCLCDAEEALIEVVNRRAAMLAAAPQSPGGDHATVPGKWIPVSERMPEAIGEYFVAYKLMNHRIYQKVITFAHLSEYTNEMGWNSNLEITHWIVVNPPCALADTLLIQKLNKGEKLAKYIKEHP